MAITGLRDTADFLSDQRPKDWRQGVLLRWPNGKAPLYALTSLLGSKRTIDPEFNWWTKDFDDQRLVLAADIAGGRSAGDALNLTVVCASGTKLSVRAGHVLLVEETGEQLLVTADPAAGGGGNTTTVATSSGFAGSTPAANDHDAAGKNPNLLVIGTALPEGSNAPTAISRNPVKVYNYTQIFRDTLAMTRTAQKTTLRTGDQVKEAKRECLEYHSVAIERALWWGRASEDVSGSAPRRTTKGILNFMDSNNIKDGATVNSGGGVRLTDMEDWLEQCFRYGSSEKMGFCGNQALLTVQRMCRKNSQGLELIRGQKEFGMNISRLITPFGEIALKTHPLFNILSSGVTAGTAYYGMSSHLVILDMEHVGPYRFIDDTKYEPKLEANDLDGMQSGYLTECGLEMHFPTNHFWIKNLVAADVDD